MKKIGTISLLAIGVMFMYPAIVADTWVVSGTCALMAAVAVAVAAYVSGLAEMIDENEDDDFETKNENKMEAKRLTEVQKRVMARYIYEHAEIYSDHVLRFEDEVALFGRTYYVRLNNEGPCGREWKYDGIWEVDTKNYKDVPINREDEKEVFDIANGMRTFSLKERSDIADTERSATDTFIDYCIKSPDFDKAFFNKPRV